MHVMLRFARQKDKATLCTIEKRATGKNKGRDQGLERFTKAIRCQRISSLNKTSIGISGPRVPVLTCFTQARFSTKVCHLFCPAPGQYLTSRGCFPPPRTRRPPEDQALEGRKPGGAESPCAFGPRAPSAVDSAALRLA